MWQDIRGKRKMQRFSKVDILATLSAKWPDKTSTLMQSSKALHGKSVESDDAYFFIPESAAGTA